MKKVFLSTAFLLSLVLAVFTWLPAVSATPPKPNELSPEVEEFIANTYLAHTAEYPDPNEPVELLRLYLEGRLLLRDGRVEEAVEFFTQAVAKYPSCRHAHAGLGAALWERYENTQAEGDLRSAIGEFTRAAEIGMKFGKVRYTYPVAWGLAQLGDVERIDRFFHRALQVRDHSYLTRMHYAQALSWLGDSRAEEWYKKAIEIQPEGNIDALAYYAEWLLDQGREEEVLQLISSDEHVEYLHFLRGVALERLGRLGEARRAYEQYIPYTIDLPVPAKYRIEGSKVQEGIVFDDKVGPLGYPCEAYDDLATLIYCEAGGESEGGMRAVGWTVRTRVFKGTLPNCVYVDNSGSTLCYKYQSVIWQPYQFYLGCQQSSPTSRHVRYDVWYGYAPDPTVGYCPNGSYSGDPCSGSVHCSSGATYGASNYGPMRFYGTTGTCPTGGEYSCLTSKDKICGNGGSDHCFYNRP
jgi:tetratricopeptide (TPR) repeat protein